MPRRRIRWTACDAPLSPGREEFVQPGPYIDLGNGAILSLTSHRYDAPPAHQFYADIRFPRLNAKPATAILTEHTLSNVHP